MVLVTVEVNWREVIVLASLKLWGGGMVPL
jgi:hypothetical protein